MHTLNRGFHFYHVPSPQDLEQIHLLVKDYNISGTDNQTPDDWYNDKHPQ